jgi:NAD(P)-dependent dehydrogenase (short-subunit alcohol dehydrogenase family)
MLLANQNVVITGGGSGIGKATARRFIEEGAAAVHIVGNNPSVLNAAAEELGPRCSWSECDVTEPQQIADVLTAIGTVDCLICCAGISLQTPLEPGDDSAWRRVTEVNQWGTVNSCRIVGQHMVDGNKGGAIVIVSSILADIAEIGSTGYAMTKAALNQLTRQLAVEWAANGIRVNAVAPGAILTPMSFALGENEFESEWFKKHFIAADRPRIPLGRPGRPEEVAEAILFLANPRNSYCTGHVLTIDGGLTIKY